MPYSPVFHRTSVRPARGTKILRILLVVNLIRRFVLFSPHPRPTKFAGAVFAPSSRNFANGYLDGWESFAKFAFK